MPGRLSVFMIATLVAAGAAACTADNTPPDPVPVELTWQELTLPAPPDGERNVVRAAAVCDGHWYVVGAYATPDWVTRPAAWTSLDGSAWRVLPVAAHSMYGIKHEMTTAVCRDGRLVALGAKVGGAHGNPRISSYHLVPGPEGDVLTEVDASFELYGGPNATNVGRMSAAVGPADPGYLIVGNRTLGAAVWRSPDGAVFEIVEGAAGLSNSPGLATWASDAAFVTGAWWVVGGARAAGRVARSPGAWRSVDARTWTAVPAEGSPESNEMAVAAAVGDTMLAVGPHGATFQAWQLTETGFELRSRFGDSTYGEIDGIQTASTAVDLDTLGDRVVALIQARGQFELWLGSPDGRQWHPLTPPVTLPATGGRTAAVAGIPGADGTAPQLLVTLDDGTSGRAFVARVVAAT